MDQDQSLQNFLKAAAEDDIALPECLPASGEISCAHSGLVTMRSRLIYELNIDSYGMMARL